MLRKETLTKLGKPHREGGGGMRKTYREKEGFGLNREKIKEESGEIMIKIYRSQIVKKYTLNETWKLIQWYLNLHRLSLVSIFDI